jgi:4-amino-4-deoxy-L-arabinose transferase-like glycosyltransferase
MKRLLFSRPAVSWAIMFLLLGLAVPFIFHNSDLTLKGEDSFEYIYGAQSLLQGHGYLAMNGGSQVIFPPGFPIAISVVGTVFNVITAARIVCLLASAISVVLVFFIARRWFGQATAVISAGLFAFLPVRVWLAQEALSESLYVALLLFGIWLVSSSLSSRLPGLFVLGLSAGYAFITRPEALIAIVGFTAVIAIRAKRKVLKPVFVYAFGLALVIVPYTAWLSGQLGHFAISGKGNNEIIRGIERLDGRQDLELRVLNNESANVTWAAGRRPSTRELAAHMARNAQQLKNLVLANIGVEPIAGALLLLGILAALKRIAKERSWEIAVLQLVLLGHLLIYIPFFTEQRFMYSSAALFCMWMALGATTLFEWLKEGTQRQAPALATTLAGFLLLAIVASFAWRLRSTNIIDSKTHASIQLAAVVRQISGDKAGVIGDYPAVAYFAGVRHEWIPYCDLAELRRFAALKHAPLIAISEQDSATPATSKLLSGDYSMQEAERLGSVSFANQDLQLFRLLPMESAISRNYR